MNKSVLLLFLTFVTGLFYAGSAKADIVLGADFTRSYFSFNNEAENYLEDNYNNVGPVVGISINGVSIEAYYKTYSEVMKDNTESKIKAYGADFVLRLPTNEYIDFVGSVGYAKYEFDIVPNHLSDEEIDCYGPRFGVGMQFNFNNHLGMRFMYHYTSLTHGIDYFDTINEVSGGIRLSF